MFTFLQDDCGATAIEYGVFVGLPFLFFVTISGNLFYKIYEAFELLSKSMVSTER